MEVQESRTKSQKKSTQTTYAVIKLYPLPFSTISSSHLRDHYQLNGKESEGRQKKCSSSKADLLSR